MSCDEWNKFIQVNIYGQTLQELSEKGIELESVLNNIGCSKVWIIEGSMYNPVDAHHTSFTTEPETTENDFVIEQAPVLSTTIAAVNCPRFSTPAVENRIDLERKFTLNLPQKFSRINSSFMDKWIDEVEDEEVVEEVLHEMIEMVVKDKEQFSTTITEVKFPRYSTPIYSQEDYVEALDIPDAISEIATDGEEEVISEYGDEPSEERTIVAEEEQVETVQSKRKEEIVAQETRIKQEVKSGPLFYSPMKTRRSMRNRPPLSRCATEHKPAYLQTPLSSSRSARPEFVENENLGKTADTLKTRFPQMNYSFDNTLEPATQSVSPAQLVSPARQESENVYYELKPMPPVDHAGSLAFQSAESFFSERRETPRNEMCYDDMDYGDNNNMGSYNGVERGDTMLIDHYEEVGPEADDMDDNEIDAELSEDDVDHGDNDNVIIASDVRTTKKVSFAKPLIEKRTRAAKNSAELNKMYIIKCYYAGCRKSYQWRPRYGRGRLLDHALSHIPNVEVKCQLCDHTFKGLRILRYHHKKTHSDVPFEGVGLRKWVDASRKDLDFDHAWETCYRENDEVHAKQLLRFERTDKGQKHVRLSLSPDTTAEILSTSRGNYSVLSDCRKPKIA